MNIKENTFKILNGMSIGIVVSLIPGAIFGQIAQLIGLTNLTHFFDLSTTFMCLMIGLCIALQYKLDGISSCTLALATFLGGGSFKGINSEGIIQLKGAGDVINAAIAASLALIILLFLDKKLKAYKLLILPGLVIVIVGIITSLSATPVASITTTIGMLISHFTTLQPILMSVLIAISFCIIIISPISTVAIALLISLDGIGAGAANLGITGTSFTLAILSYKTNGLGTALVHFLGSPKIQMANFIKYPIMIVPAICSAAICGILAALFSINGTPISAGFGISGLIGPLAHLNIVGMTTFNITITVIVFIIIPILVSFLFAYLFKNKIRLVKAENYKLDL